MSTPQRVAIMGATGAVGTELLKILEERNFPIKSLKLLASARSAGKKLLFKGQELVVETLTHESFKDIDIVLASAGGKLSRDFAPSAVKAGAIVVDNTSYFRMDPKVPLVIPEINPEAIATHQGIIANPNCSTIILLMALAPLHRKWGVKRAVVSTYQAASGAGQLAMDELLEETKAQLEGETFERTVIPHPYAFNLFPHNSAMTENGYCEEEIKMSKESQKILGAPDLKITATCVRVPILRAHSEAVNVELQKETSVEEIYTLLKNAAGLSILEERGSNRWPMPIDASGKDDCFAGRIRKDLTQANTFEFWIVGDQIRKGAALNAVQIAEKLL